MSEWVNKEIERLEEIYAIWGGSTAIDETLMLLKAMKLAEEALRTCDDDGCGYGYGKDYDVEKVAAALAAFDALGKQCSKCERWGVTNCIYSAMVSEWPTHIL